MRPVEPFDSTGPYELSGGFTPSEQRFLEAEIARERDIIDRQADEIVRLKRHTTTRGLPIAWFYDFSCAFTESFVDRRRRHL